MAALAIPTAPDGWLRTMAISSSTPVVPTWPAAADRGRGAEHEGAELHRVDAEIERCSATHMARANNRCSAATGARNPKSASTSSGRPRPPSSSRPATHPGGRKEAAPHGLHEEPLAAAGGDRHGFGPGQVDRERLLAEHVLAGLEGRHGHLVVEAVGDGDVDRVDIVVGEQLPVRTPRCAARWPVAKAWARSWSREATATSRPPSASASAVANRSAIEPVTRPHRTSISFATPRPPPSPWSCRPQSLPARTDRAHG